MDRYGSDDVRHGTVHVTCHASYAFAAIMRPDLHHIEYKRSPFSPNRQKCPFSANTAVNLWQSISNPATFFFFSVRYCLEELFSKEYYSSKVLRVFLHATTVRCQLGLLA
jgi:hypothetical protein